jgi:Ca-activated chloride channel family protein
MRRFMITMLCLLAAACPPFSVCAQNAQVIIEGKNTPALLLEDLHIDLKLVGNVSTATWTMVFRNAAQQSVDGMFEFPLENGLTVSRFALDIEGRLRDAVPVPKGNKVDKSEHSNLSIESVFRRPVGTIAPGGSRTIVVGYEQKMLLQGNSLEYRLPLGLEKAPGNLKVSVTSYHAGQPEIAKGSAVTMSFERLGGVWTGEAMLSNAVVEKPFIVRLPQPKVASVLMQAKGDKYYCLIQTPVKRNTMQRALPNHITILWDASLSGIRRNKAAELEMLDGYLKRIANATVNLVVFSNTVEPMTTFPIRNGDWHLLREAIEGISYDGATLFGKLDLRKMPGREFLLFSDGLPGLGNSEIITGRQPVYCINSTRRADLRTLGQVASKSGGRVIDLTGTLMHIAMDKLLNYELQLIGVGEDNDVTQVYPDIPVPAAEAAGLSAIISKKEGELTLLYGYANVVTERQVVNFDADQRPVHELDLDKMWASRKMASLDVAYEQNRKAIESIGRRFSLPGRNTSLVILKDAEDYARYGVVAPEDLKDAYDKAVEKLKEQKSARIQIRFATAQHVNAQLGEWWNKTTSPVKGGNLKSADTEALVTKGSQPQVENSKRVLIDAPVLSGSSEALVAGVTDPEIKGSFYTFIDEGDPLFGIGEGRRELRKLRELNADLDSVARVAQRTDSALLDSLFSRAPEVQYPVYIGLRPARLQSPEFYFQVAERFISSGRKEEGLRILSSLAELELEDEEVCRMLAYKLKELGEVTPALEAFRKVVALRPKDLTARRELGIALADGGYYEAAVDTLYSALLSENMNEDSTQIIETLLCDINGVLTQHPEALPKTMPRNLVQRLPADMRVLITWNTADADIDLVVTDPNGERCYYANDTTAAGGRLSGDIRNGHGPEQFLVRTTLPGKYRMEVVQSDNAARAIARPVTVMAEIYTGWGKPEQRRYITVVHMKPEEARRKVIGEFEVGMRL